MQTNSTEVIEFQAMLNFGIFKLIIEAESSENNCNNLTW